MMLFKLFISSLLVTTATVAVAAQTTENNLSTSSNTFCPTNSNEVVDINRFTQLLSNHLLFDHFDKAYLQLSRKISFQFRDAIQVRVKKIKTSKSKEPVTNKAAAVIITPPPVDVQILKRQLKGAVGCEFLVLIIVYIITEVY
jgi:hypothetical protein